MRIRPFRVLMFLLVCSLITVAWSQSAFAQQRTDNTSAVNPLVRMLQAKGILSAAEVAQLAQASSASDADQRLAKLLLMKGVISQADYDQTVSTASVINASAPASSSPTVVAAVYVVPVNNVNVASGAPARTAPPGEPEVETSS